MGAIYARKTIIGDEEIIELDLNKPWSTPGYLEDVERLRSKKLNKNFIKII